MNQSRPIPLADQRTAEILESARSAFAEKGFDGASMQDLARKAGMSVGNFYRYFPSKAAIVEALIAADLAEMEGDFASIRESADPFAALRAKIEFRVTEESCARDGQLWAEITAAALRKPEIGEAACRMEDAIVGYLCAIFAQATGQPFAEACSKWMAHAHLIVMLVKASSMQRPDLNVSPDLTQLVLRTIDRTLDEITRSAAKG